MSYYYHPVDYLIGGSSNVILNKKILKRRERKIYSFIDMTITYNKAKKHDKMKKPPRKKIVTFHLYQIVYLLFRSKIRIQIFNIYR